MDPKKVEELARKLCRLAGNQPDDIATPHAPWITYTPQGQVHGVNTGFPLWMFWRHTAEEALKEAASSLS